MGIPMDGFVGSNFFSVSLHKEPHTMSIVCCVVYTFKGAKYEQTFKTWEEGETFVSRRLALHPSDFVVLKRFWLDTDSDTE